MKVLKKLCNLLSSQPVEQNELQAHIYPRDQHTISRKKISKSALDVLYSLKKAGFAAYLVGGCVRDLLLEIDPKDYDVATNATPEQLKSLFKRRCRLIGKRFRLAHVRFGRDIIEVTTFRGESRDIEDSHQQKVSEHGMIVRDNVFGTLEEDVVRRDFTVNALYYNINDFSLVDFVGGRQDLEAGLLRVIGDPAQRFREDPVRMLRAIRFAAKLNFTIEDQARETLIALNPLLQHVPPARLFLEFEKMFLFGFAGRSFKQLCDFQLLTIFSPAVQNALSGTDAQQVNTFIELLLLTTDNRIAQKKPVSPAYFIASLLWLPMQALFTQYRQTYPNLYEAHHQAADDILVEQFKTLMIPRRYVHRIKGIWLQQLQMTKLKGRLPLAILNSPHFRSAYDFLLMRAQIDESCQELANWWQNFIKLDEKAREQKVLPKRKRRTTR